MRAILILLLLAIIAGLVYYRRRQVGIETETRESAKQLTHKDSRYHAVSIRFPANACAAAKQMAGVRHMASEAPPLPLPGCTAARCECRYVHHDDRRSGKDRRSPFAAGGLAGSTGKFDMERRDGADRRRDAGD